MNFHTLLSPGILPALLSALLFGSSTLFSKWLLNSVHPGLLAGILYLGSGIGLSIGFLWRKNRGLNAEQPLAKPDLPYLLGAILFGGILAPWWLMHGIARTPASNASLLLNMEGVFTALLAWFIFGENFDRRIALGMALITLGGLTLSYSGGWEWGAVAGPLLILLACLAWGIDNNLTRFIAGGDPVQIAGVKGLVAGLSNLLLNVWYGAPWPTPTAFGGALILGFFSYGLSLVLFILALRDLGSARTGAYFSTAPFWGAILSLIFLREPVTAPLLIAAMCMVGGLYLHLTENHDHEHHHEDLIHAHLHTHDDHHPHDHDFAVRAGEWHSHEHRHEPLVHKHPHFPDIHHRHGHGGIP